MLQACAAVHLSSEGRKRRGAFSWRAADVLVVALLEEAGIGGLGDVERHVLKNNSPPKQVDGAVTFSNRR